MIDIIAYRHRGW